MEITDFTGIFDSTGKFRTYTLEDLCITLIAFSEKSRREGLLALDDDIEDLENIMIRDFLALVVDGTDPEIVLSIGETRITAIIHYLEEILACVEFSILNADKNNYETIFKQYVKSRELGIYSTLVETISIEIKAVMAGELNTDDASERYRDFISMLQPDMDEQFRREILKNHVNTIIYSNRIYNRIILTGILSIQSGDNPRVLKEKIISYVPQVKFNSYDDEDECAGSRDNDCGMKELTGKPLEIFLDAISRIKTKSEQIPGAVIAGELLASENKNNREYILTDKINIRLNNKYAGNGFAPGINTAVSGDNLISQINGDILFADGKINVVPVYFVNGDVSLETGSIVFNGSVVVNGSVNRNFQVKASGNVYIHGAIDEGAVVDAEGEVVVIR